MPIAVARRSARIPQAPAITTAAARNQGSPGNNASIAAVAIVAKASNAAAMRDGLKRNAQDRRRFHARLGARARDAVNRPNGR